MLAHEITHVTNRDILIGVGRRGRWRWAITFIARMAMWGAMFGGGSDDETAATSSAPC